MNELQPFTTIIACLFVTIIFLNNMIVQKVCESSVLFFVKTCGEQFTDYQNKNFATSEI